MDLSPLTLEELERKLSDLDQSKSPHEALELSNEIGRRKAEHVSIHAISAAQSSVNAVPAASRLMFIGFIVFLVTCHFEAPDIRIIKIVGALSVLYTLVSIVIWKTRKYGLEIAVSSLMMAILGHYKFNLIEIVQYCAFFYGVHYALVFLFQDKVKSVIQNHGSKDGHRKYVKTD